MFLVITRITALRLPIDTRLVPSRYLFVFKARVACSERSARGVTGRGEEK